MKTTFATAALSACLALGAAPAFAAGTMGHETRTDMDRTPTAGQAMHKDKMGMEKQDMRQDPMAKDGKSAMGHMDKKGMEKGAMGKAGMKQ